ncbi:hypothetical protein ACFXKJ_02205, partial [Kitasatospora indigofera]
LGARHRRGRPNPRGQRGRVRQVDHREHDPALADLATYVRGVWDNLVGEEGIPDQPPTDDREAVRLYYGPERDGRPDEGYDLYAAPGPRHRLARGTSTGRGGPRRLRRTGPPRRSPRLLRALPRPGERVARPGPPGAGRAAARQGD